MPRLLVERKIDWKSCGVPIELKHHVNVNFAVQWRRCNKNCSECPHGPYAFAVIGSGSSKRRILLGALSADSPLAPERPKTKLQRKAATCTRRRR